MDREKQIIQLLQDTRGVLAYQRSCSVLSYPKEPELESFFQNCNWQTAARSISDKEGPKGSSPPKIAAIEKPVITKKSEQRDLAEIAAEVAVCNACSLSEQRTYPVAGIGGGERIRLLLIGHWLPGPGNSTAVFGAAEDLMLKRMLAAINMPMEQVFITNVIKCDVGSDIQPQAEHIDACSSYLKRQIAAIEPELICAMGMVATKALLRMSQPLSRLRGRFYPYMGVGGVEIPLLPTYHPGYLLQNPEMKRATWLDLQAIEKRLLEGGKERC